MAIAPRLDSRVSALDRMLVSFQNTEPFLPIWLLHLVQRWRRVLDDLLHFRKRRIVNWIQRMDEPFFTSRKQAERWITQELEGSVPDGWKVQYLQRSLSWYIQPTSRSGVLGHNYVVELPRSLEYVIFFY